LPTLDVAGDVARPLDAPTSHTNEAEHRRLIAVRANIGVTEQSGTWVPTVTFATPGDLSVSYASQVGRYTRIGSLVRVVVEIEFTPTYTTASGQLRISLPFEVTASPAVGSVNGASVDMTMGAFISTGSVASGSPVVVRVNAIAG
jgi:hypothetical protein